MIAMQIPQRSLPGKRPVFRVLCAWCEQVLESAKPAEDLTGNSHSICPPCALRYFGLNLDARATENPEQ